MPCRLAVALLLALLACSRPQHSPEYARAATLWTEVVRARPGDAAEDGRAGEVLRLLDAVPADSLDSAAAADLRQRIEAGRAAAAAERAHRASLGAAAEHAHRALLGAAAEATRSPPPVAAEAPASGRPRTAATPTAGMKVDELRTAHGACFEPRGEVDVAAEDGGRGRGDAWFMKDDPGCRDRYPNLVGQALLVTGGSVVGATPAATALVATQRRETRTPAEFRRQVQLAELPDGGLGMVVDGGVAPLPPGARVVAGEGGATR